ncbi:MAG: hypothetical protein HQ574_00385 [Chloroflexi bacterium]|nr:hypothetical protein [Chloroflexota bacterium]
MEDKLTPSVKSVVPVSLVLSIPGWFWLIYLVTQTLPDLGNRWMFFASFIIAITGSSIPAVTYLNRIIKPFGPANFDMIIRESIMIGVYAGILLWLNKGQVLSISLALILAVGLFLIEMMIRLRNRSEWHPDD